MKTIGIIGLGSIGNRHSQNLKAMGYSVLGYDPDITDKISPIRLESIEKVIRDSDALVIASPTDLHYEHIYKCLQKTMSVFVEKPIAHSLEEPHDPTLLRQVMMVGYNLRFHASVKRAKAWLDEERIGKPLWASFTLGQHSIKPPYLRDGVILNWSHEIDLALYLLGDANVMGSNTVLRDGQDIMTDILLTHKAEGCRTIIHLDYITDPQQRHFRIVGSNGAIFVDLDKRTSQLWGDGTYHESDNWNDNYIEEMQAFLDRCDGKETLGCTGEEALKVLKICLEVRKQAGLA